MRSRSDRECRHDPLHPRPREPRQVTLKASEGTVAPPPISRAINIKAEEAQVVAVCKKHKVVISAIETLPAGGTRVVLTTATEAAVIAKAFASKVITGPVTRTSWIRGR
jgi:hypothetical protein